MIRSIATVSLVTVSLGLLAFSAPAGNDAPPTPETVIAIVNGTKITYGEFEDKRADGLFLPRDAFYQQERKVLDDYIQDALLKQEAAKEGLTVDQLLDKHVRSTLPKDPSDEALRVYYEGVDTKEPFEALRGRILDHIRQVRFDKAKAAYLATLRKQANVIITLAPPRIDIPLKNTPTLGDVNAPVVVVEYADYECPYCQAVAPTLSKLETEYKGKVEWAFKDTPLPQHPHAEKAAEAAHCAGLQGKYWDYHNELFETKKLEIADLKDDARKLNLDTAAFDKCLDSGSQAAAIKTQLSESADLGVQATPTFFINGRMVSGTNYDQLKEVIDQELVVAKHQPRQTASR